ncbi:hypothetical protein P43SY_001477 [Pythium insidiosum]|uniref:Uncharacterized protein n=1 Tax=Pythium insidiosum TaxID=114742 RepID=A0AAD5QAK4_PYTIN|nr:hypothetical protein P43SY_001477 [Pythium insidiosum]
MPPPTVQRHQSSGSTSSSSSSSSGSPCPSPRASAAVSPVAAPPTSARPRARSKPRPKKTKEAPPSPASETAAHSSRVREILSSLRAMSAVSSSTASPSKKRRRDEDLAQLTSSTASKPTTARNGAALSATHEIRHLRQEVASMEERLASLESRWMQAIPDDSVLSSACHAAQQKWTTMQVERVNAELRDQLTQQQFVFASLQSAILQAPLQSRCQEMWDAVHVNTVLNNQSERRVQQLQAHLRKGLDLVPHAIKRFTSQVSSSPNPYSQVNVTGGADCTTVGSVVVLEFPQVSLIELFKAVLTYYALLPEELHRYTATETDIQLLNSLGNLSQYARVRFTSEIFPTTVNTAFTAAIVDGVAIFHSDTIEQDSLFPAPEHEDIRRIGVTAMTITPETDASTGKTKMVLRRILLHRYNRLPHDPRIQRDLKQNQCVMNGDLLTAIVCRSLHERRPDVVVNAAAGLYLAQTPAGAL